MKVLLQILGLLLCLTSSSYASTRFLAISDIHYGSQNSSEIGQDTGPGLLAVALNQYKLLSQEVDFILTLGDLPTHLFGYSPNKELYEQAVFHGLFSENHEHKPLFYISGNNDPLVGNYQPFEYNGKSPLSFADDWSGAACVYCDNLIIDDSHMRSGGYYSSYVKPGNQEVVLVVLNATQWVKTPRFLPKYPNQDDDAALQLSWLEDQLKNNKSKQLLIAMHEPPGLDYKGDPIWLANHLQKFLELLDAHHKNFDQITILTSHTHMDELRKIELSDGKSIYAFSTPSISRVHYNNTAMKIFDLDDNMAMKNFTTYYTTSNKQWGNDQYQAMGSSSSIFPHCQTNNLAECLNQLTDTEICQSIEQGLFYSVKSNRINNKQCRTILRVN